MDISKAKKVYELSKGNKKILVTLWPEDKISSCVTEELPPTSLLEFPPPAAKQYCETCQCDDETCQAWIDHLKEIGYQATEIELGEFAIEESLPKFLEEREATIRVHPTSVTAHEVHAVIEAEEGAHADIETAEAVPGSPGELQPGESGSGSPETS